MLPLELTWLILKLCWCPFLLAIKLLTVMTGGSILCFTLFFPISCYFWYLKKCSLEIQVLNKYFPSGGLLNLNHKLKKRAVLIYYLACHMFVFFSVCILVNKLEMEHLANVYSICHYFEKTCSSSPIDSPSGHANKRMELGVKPTCPHVPTSLVANWNDLITLRLIFLICKMGVERVPVSKTVLKIKCTNAGKWLHTLPVYIKCSRRISCLLRDSEIL